MHNYVFGDTGGHSVQLWRSLKNIGVDLENFRIPENVRIIHLGDLIHKGPDSSLMLETVDRLMVNNPDRWVQILGNHEFQHIEGSPYFWKCTCSLGDVDVINRWFDEGLAAASFAVSSHNIVSLEVSVKPKNVFPHKSILFTHAGLTKQWWEGLNMPSNALEASKHINSLPAYVVTAAGQMLGVKGNAGPVWALGSGEVFKSWEESTVDMPFIQFHGHTSSYHWGLNKWWRNTPDLMSYRKSTKLNPELRASSTYVAGSVIVGLDPSYSVKADNDEQPYVMFESM